MEQKHDSEQTVPEQEQIDNESYVQGYDDLLKSCYNNMIDSRLIKHQDTDFEALSYFGQLCNRTLPRNSSETETKNMFRQLYYADKTSYLRCVNNAPHFVLLTEARAIVLHFGIHEIVYIEWKDDQYEVRKNDYYSYSRSERRSIRSKSGHAKRIGKQKYKSKQSFEQPRVMRQQETPSSDDIIQNLSERIKKLEEDQKKVTKKKVIRKHKEPSPIVLENIYDGLKGSSESWGDIAESESDDQEQ